MEKKEKLKNKVYKEKAQILRLARGNRRSGDGLKAKFNFQIVLEKLIIVKD